MAKTYVEPTLIDRIRADYFSSRMDTTMTTVFGALALWVIYNLVSWGIVNAVWSAENRDLCAQGSGGARWGVINSRWRLILFGHYPYEEQWRSALALSGDCSGGRPVLCAVFLER